MTPCIPFMSSASSISFFCNFSCKGMEGTIGI